MDDALTSFLAQYERSFIQPLEEEQERIQYALDAMADAKDDELWGGVDGLDPDEMNAGHGGGK